MKRSDYPALRDNPEIIHLDASAAFPLHERVIEDLNKVFNESVGTPSKASYDWAQSATMKAQYTRETVASFLGTKPKNIFFSHSASEGFARLGEILQIEDRFDTLVYSPEDHISLVDMLSQTTTKGVVQLTYAQDGTYLIPDSITDSKRTIFFLSHLHHMYGRTNDVAAIRKQFPQSVIIVDACQSVGRKAVKVEDLGCDALLFSAYKVGGLVGVGITYISDGLIPSLKQSLISMEPSTLSLPAIVALSSAINILTEHGTDRIEQELSRMTLAFIEEANNRIPTLTFVKGPAYSQYTCYGNGIVCFKVQGYSSQDVAMILNNTHINVRAGDHCVDKDTVDRDVVRISMHVYTTDHDMQKLIIVLKSL